MAWNTAETQAKLKAAAVTEFAANGLAGTRVESIARRAGVNKERLYKYFGNKEDLFAVVISEELARIAAAVPVLEEDGEDIGEYAGRCFDYHCDHPELVRLLHWEALELSGTAAAPDEEGRKGEYEAKTGALRKAQRDGELIDEVGAPYLLFIVMAMAAWWTAVPQVARMVTGVDAEADRAARRAAVVTSARRLAPAAPPRSRGGGGTARAARRTRA
ncbi:MAG TPA: TetR family transcriptional regulator [Solirubrobacterales bacterium]|nr:TetR family transcriptional regulator [Solirubrobacterales bacterium]